MRIRLGNRAHAMLLALIFAVSALCGDAAFGAEEAAKTGRVAASVKTGDVTWRAAETTTMIGQTLPQKEAPKYLLVQPYVDSAWDSSWVRPCSYTRGSKARKTGAAA